ncbi:peptidoglycan-binding protein LysM [Vibrio scophthalmi]|uniref:Uncharacterized protein n=1 Tax=Vibrio scophthalmi TaxID=45658 RepID=A0A1C7FEN7_9VIBR|nr:peptidoglycan-binding protein LysM [Vibrio scophthalmi]ANU37824.1 hypothetical protein VSVS05_02753 [Vibrio scophthalmi]
MYRILPAIVLLILSLLTLTQASANLTSSADQTETGIQAKPLVKLSPKIRISQAQPQDQSHSITSSYRHDFSFLPALLLTKLELDRASRVLGARSGRRLLSDNEALIIQGSYSQRLWGIYRPLDTYVRDEQTVVVLKHVAIAELQFREKHLSTLQVRQQQQEILRDDVVLPLDSQTRDAHSFAYSPSPIMENRLTTILGAIDGRDYVVKNQIVVLNRGQQEGVVQGSWFDLYQAPVLSDHLATDEKRVIEKLPSLSIGRLRVIDAEQYFSLALVTESRQPIGFDTVVQSSSSADSTHSLTAPIAIASGGEMR